VLKAGRQHSLFVSWLVAYTLQVRDYLGVVVYLGAQPSFSSIRLIKNRIDLWLLDAYKYPYIM